MVGVILAGAAVLAQGSFTSMNTLSASWKEMEVRSGDMARTELEVADTSESSPYAYITLYNSGQTALLDFAAWDVVAQWYNSSDVLQQQYMAYTASNPPGNNQWTVTGIYTNSGASNPEVYQPGILDPDEYMVIRLKFSPAQRQSSQTQTIIGTPNGVTVSRTY
mgnify:CR=1 FL=1